MKTERESRICGCIAGLAYGDAFGMPVEMWSPQQISSRFGFMETFQPGQPDSVVASDLRQGETTDDTAHMVAVLETLCENGGVLDPMKLVQKLRHWSSTCTKSVAVTGPSTAHAFAQLDAGVPMEETGKTGTTNGAAMKAAPLGLVTSITELEALVEQVRLLCLPTHNTSVALSGADAIAAATACALACPAPDSARIVEAACKGAELGEKLGAFVAAPSVAKRIAHGIRLVEESHSVCDALEAVYHLIGTGLPSYEAVPAALSFAYLADWDPRLCAIYAANAGGDTDTVAAMGCAVCGAARGMEAFPPQEVQMLERVNRLSFEEMAIRLAGI